MMNSFLRQVVEMRLLQQRCFSSGKEIKIPMTVKKIQPSFTQVHQKSDRTKSHQRLIKQKVSHKDVYDSQQREAAAKLLFNTPSSHLLARQDDERELEVEDITQSYEFTQSQIYMNSKKYTKAQALLEELSLALKLTQKLSPAYLFVQRQIYTTLVKQERVKDAEMVLRNILLTYESKEAKEQGLFLNDERFAKF